MPPANPDTAPALLQRKMCLGSGVALGCLRRPGVAARLTKRTRALHRCSTWVAPSPALQRALNDSRLVCERTSCTSSTATLWPPTSPSSFPSTPPSPPRHQTLHLSPNPPGLLGFQGGAPRSCWGPTQREAGHAVTLSMNPPTSAFQAVPEVAYATLEAAMQNWSHRVGQGGYGEVFAGDLNNAKVKPHAVEGSGAPYIDSQPTRAELARGWPCAGGCEALQAHSPGQGVLRPRGTACRHRGSTRSTLPQLLRRERESALSGDGAGCGRSC